MPGRGQPFQVSIATGPPELFDPSHAMPVIAVVNRKGGSGKSTLATHLAAYCANVGLSVMLGDADRQQSAQAWLRLRAAQKKLPGPAILGRTVDPTRGLQAPAGTIHVILDTPGGLTGFELARVVMMSDAILLPVCHSMFDRVSAAQCHAELLTFPRVTSGRCRVAAVGMRLDARTRAAAVLRDWAQGLELPFVGVLRESQAYVRCLENGMTLFDLPPARVEADLTQWGPILQWLAPSLRPVARDAEPARRAPTPARVPVASPAPAPVRLPVLTATVRPATLAARLRDLFDLRPMFNRARRRI